MTGFYSTTSPASLTGRIRFFWLLALLTELTADDGVESLSPPVAFGSSACPASAGVRAPGRLGAPVPVVRGLRGKARAVIGPPRASGPVPPEEPAPTATAGGRTDPLPVSVRYPEQATCQRQVGVRSDFGRLDNSLWTRWLRDHKSVGRGWLESAPVSLLPVWVTATFLRVRL